MLKGKTCILRRCSKEVERRTGGQWAEYVKIGDLSININGILVCGAFASGSLPLVPPVIVYCEL